MKDIDEMIKEIVTVAYLNGVKTGLEQAYSDIKDNLDQIYEQIAKREENE